MQSFLNKVAEYIINKHPEGLDGVSLVLPSKRASLFLKRHISSIMKKTIWSPDILSVENFVRQYSDHKIVDNISLLFELYEVHKIIAKDKKQDFDEFSKWGQVLLHDFNEIDMHMAPSENIFDYLTDIKSLTHWNPEHLEPTEFQKQYISFFKSLHTYYVMLNEKLDKKKQCYIGSAFRKVAENIANLQNDFKLKKLYFIGFNALTKSEEEILFGLKKNGVAEVLWDADHFYMDRSEAGLYHEAGLFLRKYLKEFGEDDFNWIQQDFKNNDKQIHLYGIPKQVGQAKFCGQILSQNPDIINDTFNSAIVLADENLLFPILNSLPELKELNATMGIPLASSPAYDFISSYLNLFYNSETYSKANTKSEIVYHVNDIKKLLTHPFINNLYDELFNCDLAEFQSSLLKINVSNKVFYNNKDLSKILPDSKLTSNLFAEKLFFDWKNVNEGIERIKTVLSLIKDAYLNKRNERITTYQIELEYLFQFSLIFNKIENYQQTYNSISGLKTFISLFKQLCRSEKLSLFGEPLQGMQLMGMLETRVLDFKNLIICSVNENILPSSSKQNSFIPYDIKKAYKLPTYREKNAIFAYHFFRLIQKAETVHILYNTEADILAGGDKSRFLLQIQEELALYNSNIRISEQLISSEIRAPKNTVISVPKTDEVLKALHRKAKNGFSATGLSSYIRCPLQFYYKEIAQIYEHKQTEETIDAATLGQVIHDALQVIYTPLIDKRIDVEFIQSQLKNLDNILRTSFSELYIDGNIEYGKNYLINRIAKIYLQRFLKNEIKLLKSGSQIFVKSLEVKYFRNLKVDGISVEIVLKGFVDRLDEKDGILRIIDYKTGSVIKRDLEVKDVAEVFEKSHKEKCFQLMFYAVLLKDMVNSYNDSNCGIYSLKKMSQDFIQLQLPNKNEKLKDCIPEFENELQNLFVEIFNPELSYDQTSDLNICKLCDYKTVCNRA